jgi:hypothetical protein
MSEFIGDKVVAILRGSGFQDEANELKKLLGFLISKDASERKKAAFQVEGLCQMRAYGDLKIEGINGWAWNSMLQKLRNYATQKSK